MPIQAAAEQRVIGLVERVDVAHLVNGALLQMILQIGPHPASLENYLNAERCKPLGPADPRRCRFAASRSRPRTVSLRPGSGPRMSHRRAELHAEGTTVLNDQPFDQHVDLELQVCRAQYRL